ncbi:unnamed protein product, partial [Mesorhabditis belari]|uniref:Ionotropic glutamate receptor L-glutamate and glycine-binding domain-containing protein n=1 Tax=Mesorhabditis belari TaxID=2138241 RepID=A0AAF3FBB0_9BILA
MGKIDWKLLSKYNSNRDVYEVITAKSSSRENLRKLEGNVMKVAVYLEAPFVMHDEEAERRDPKNGKHYKGYCIDLLSKIAETLNFTYILHEVKDKTYGSKDASGQWNGLVGELLRGVSEVL